jgi:hypothetical protein
MILGIGSHYAILPVHLKPDSTPASPHPLPKLIGQPVSGENRLFFSHDLCCLGVSLGQFASRGSGSPRIEGGGVILVPIDRLEFLQGKLVCMTVGIAHVDAAGQGLPRHRTGGVGPERMARDAATSQRVVHVSCIQVRWWEICDRRPCVRPDSVEEKRRLLGMPDVGVFLEEFRQVGDRHPLRNAI